MILGFVAIARLPLPGDGQALGGARYAAGGRLVPRPCARAAAGVKVVPLTQSPDRPMVMAGMLLKSARRQPHERNGGEAL